MNGTEFSTYSGLLGPHCELPILFHSLLHPEFPENLVEWKAPIAFVHHHGGDEITSKPPTVASPQRRKVLLKRYRCTKCILLVTNICFNCINYYERYVTHVTTYIIRSDCWSGSQIDLNSKIQLNGLFLFYSYHET